MSAHWYCLSFALRLGYVNRIMRISAALAMEDALNDIANEENQ